MERAFRFQILDKGFFMRGFKSAALSLFLAQILCAPLLFVFTSNAQAACVNPVGDHGDMLYNRDHTVMQYCNGTDWIGMGGGGAAADNLGDHTATKDLDMATFKLKNVAIPTSSADGVNKAYVDAAVAAAASGGDSEGSGSSVVLADYYQTTAAYNGAAAGSACAPDYQMCGMHEWIGRPYNYTLGPNFNSEGASWVQMSKNYNCSNWTSTSVDGIYTTTSNNGGPTYAPYYFYRSGCSSSFRVLCCKIYNLGQTGSACVDNSLCFATQESGTFFWGDTVTTNLILPNNFL
ncbi:MAG: hypothetical protein DI626_04295, partial [Micavibrio aeruginosavorus]